MSRNACPSTCAVIASLVACVLPTQVIAFEGSWQVGLNLGISRLSPDTGSSSFSLDDEQSSLVGAYVGIDVTPVFSAELAFTDLGEAELSQGQNIGYRSFSIGATAYVWGESEAETRSEGTSGYLRLGLSSIDNDADVALADADNTSIWVAAGLQFPMSDSWGFRTELASFDGDAQGLMAGVYWRRGVRAAQNAPQLVPQSVPVESTNSSSAVATPAPRRPTPDPVPLAEPSPGAQTPDPDALAEPWQEVEVPDPDALGEPRQTDQTPDPDPLPEPAPEVQTTDPDPLPEPSQELEAPDSDPLPEPSQELEAPDLDPLSESSQEVQAPEPAELPETPQEQEVEAPDQPEAPAAPIEPDQPSVETAVADCPPASAGKFSNPANCGLLNDSVDGLVFIGDSSVIEPASLKALDPIVTALQQNPRVVLEIRAHVQGSGDLQIDAQLSGQRAKSVARYLVQNGISIDQLRARAFGSAQPLASGDSSAAQRVNNRIELSTL